MTEPLRVLALASYPELAAGTRLRVLQYVPLLAEQGIAVDVRPFLSNRTFAGMYDRRRAVQTALGIAAGIGRRAADAFRLGRYDAVWLQREAALVGPPIVERLARHTMPLVLDLDDATYIERESLVFGKAALTLKWRGKTDQLIRLSDHVISGNRTIAAHAASFGKAATVLPSIVDVDVFRPLDVRSDGPPVIGWIGTHSTYPYLRSLTEVFERLAREHRFRLRLIGAGTTEVAMNGVDVESLPWRMERELADLQSFDIGVYPMESDEWAAGKSGLKAIQYLSCGVPYVASPVGIVSEIGVAGSTHFEARSANEWVDALGRLLADDALRAEMARRARAYAVGHFSVRQAAATIAEVLRALVTARKKSDRP